VSDRPRFELVADRAAVHEAFAGAIADEIAANNQAGRPTCLILPVGPVAHYPLLAEITNERRISWSDVSIVTMDEYLDWTGRPIAEAHPLSFTGFMRRFLASIDAPLRPEAGRYVAPDPFDIDRVSAFLAEAGGPDTCYGGIGVHGHVAFNEPPLWRFGSVTEEQFLASPTRVVTLAPETVVMNATRSWGGRLEDFPPMAVTVGMADILSADRIRLFCDGGAWQQHALRRAVLGPAGLDHPASLLTHHPDVTIVADAVTAETLLTDWPDDEPRPAVAAPRRR
jgi:glucosamine-6-phosphate deaminase